jgi:hypothetical protein
MAVDYLTHLILGLFNIVFGNLLSIVHAGG